MFYKFLVRKAGNVLLAAGLVMALSTSTFAQSEPVNSASVNTAPTTTENASLGSNHLFLPLVQNTAASEPADGLVNTTGDNAEVSAAFTGNWNYWWGDTKTSAVDIGTSVGRTCFLSGIGGHLRPIGAYLYSGGAYPAQAGVRKKANGNYELFVQPEAGRHLSAAARCVNSAAGRIEASWSTYQQSTLGDKVIGAVTSKRQCFLQSIQNYPVALKDSTGAIYSYSWAFDDKPHPDLVQVVKNSSNWRLSITAGAHSYPVNIGVTAVCLDANEFDGLWYWQVGDPGTAQFDLTNVAGATCGISGIKGHFDAALGDWNDQINITTVGNQFKLNLANGKGSTAICMK